MKHILEHFKAFDPVLFSLAQKIPIPVLKKSDDYFADLVENIVSQQLSDKAAGSIFMKVKTLFPGSVITPERILMLPDQSLRDAGLSWSKVSFLKALAESKAGNTIDLVHIDSMTDRQVIDMLTQVKGIGSWTGEMFLMFSLGREDVFSHGDLGLRKAIMRLYRKKKEPSRKWVETIAKKWSPYRTYACLLLWRSLNLSDAELAMV